ncbi:MAG: DUF2971 domain-containing protein, partial [Acidobacteriaceae bacterium]
MERSIEGNDANIPVDAKRAPDNFEDGAKAISYEELKHLNESPVPILYHYTNDIGLRGILDSGKLWFTSVAFLNDPSELRHGVSLAMDLLDNETAQLCDAQRQFAQGFRSLMPEVVQRIKKLAFVCSFSQCGDDLGQWRAYADDGRGYALGFCTERLKKAFEPATNAQLSMENLKKKMHETFQVRYNHDDLSK